MIKTFINNKLRINKKRYSIRQLYIYIIYIHFVFVVVFWGWDLFI